MHMSYVTTNGPTRVCTHVCLAVSSRSTQPDILGGGPEIPGVRAEWALLPRSRCHAGKHWVAFLCFQGASQTDTF